MKLLHLSKGHKYICGEKDFLWRVQSDKKINSSLTKNHETLAEKCLKKWRSSRCFVCRQWMCSPEPSALFLQSEQSWGEVERRNSPNRQSNFSFPSVWVYNQGENHPRNIFLVNGNTGSLKIFCCFSHFSFPSFSAVEVIKLACAKEKLRASVNTWNSRCEGIFGLYKVTWWRSWALNTNSNDSV